MNCVSNAQTFLLNLVHKGLVQGMLPKIHMVNYGVHIVRYLLIYLHSMPWFLQTQLSISFNRQRPMIHVSEEDIRAFAQHYGYLRITCRCPVGAESRRKKVETLIEDMQETFGKQVISNLANAALYCGSDKASRPSKIIDWSSVHIGVDAEANNSLMSTMATASQMDELTEPDKTSA